MYFQQDIYHTLCVWLYTECDCGGQADLCKQDDGVCYCNTRGVIGDRCTQYVLLRIFFFIIMPFGLVCEGDGLSYIDLNQ